MSMGLQGVAAQNDYLRGRFGTQWGSRTPVSWPNKKLTPPDGSAWVRFSVGNSGGERINPGTGTVQRYDGMVIVEVFVPLGSGDGPLDDHCQVADDIFRDHNAQEGLRCGTPWVVDVGAFEDTWYKKDVLCPFVRDTIYS